MGVDLFAGRVDATLPALGRPPRILIFDSGLGGLTVLAEVAKAFPKRIMPNPDLGYYSRSIQTGYDGETSPLDGGDDPGHHLGGRQTTRGVMDEHGRVLPQVDTRQGRGLGQCLQAGGHGRLA